MAASQKTVEEIYSIVRKHVNDKQMEEIIDDLLQVSGNRSFCDTIKRLAAIDVRTRGGSYD